MAHVHKQSRGSGCWAEGGNAAGTVVHGVLMALQMLWGEKGHVLLPPKQAFLPGCQKLLSRGVSPLDLNGPDESQESTSRKSCMILLSRYLMICGPLQAWYAPLGAKHRAAQ